MRRYAKNIINVFFLLMIHQMSRAQHYFFVEAEGGQAFYMRIYDTLYSSTGEGFLIIPKVSDNMITFTVGFPRGVFPEVKFELSGMDHDRGFLLKHNLSNSWVLIDRQSQAQYQGSGSVSNIDNVNKKNKPSVSADFANMLAEVTSDKSLLSQTPSAVKLEPAKKDSVFTEPKKEILSDSLHLASVFEVDKFKPILSKIAETRSVEKVEIDF